MEELGTAVSSRETSGSETEQILIQNTIQYKNSICQARDIVYDKQEKLQQTFLSKHWENEVREHSCPQTVAESAGVYNKEW